MSVKALQRSDFCQKVQDVRSHKMLTYYLQNEPLPKIFARQRAEQCRHVMLQSRKIILYLSNFSQFFHFGHANENGALKKEKRAKKMKERRKVSFYNIIPIATSGWVGRVLLNLFCSFGRSIDVKKN